jgi:D-alanyl-D-alanine carboxypeptidase (penicillin-binding protein 5/6)
MRRLPIAVVVGLVFAGSAHGAAPRPDARAYFVVNASNGEVLEAHNAHARVAVASITKLMTVIVALDHLKPDDVVTVSRSAAQVGESRIPLVRGQRISVHDLLEGALIQSANNAADALADAASG